MRPKHQLIFFILLWLAWTAKAQTNFPQAVNRQLNQYILGNVQEKIYLQTNSDQYSPGDTVWFKTSLVNAINHKPVTIEYLCYVDLISPENKLAGHQLFILDGGFSDGFLVLGRALVPGRYKLLAYTNYMRNFPTDFLFQRTIELVPGQENQTKWEFSSKVFPLPGGDSVFVNMYGQPVNGRELNNEVTVQVQLARGTVLGAPCPVTGNAGSFRFFVPDSLKLPVALLTVKQNGEAGSNGKYRVKLSVQRPDLQFLPEGGELVAGQENQLAFRCVDADGNPTDVQGELLDNNGKMLVRFATQYEGMGSMQITPQTGQLYTAGISYRDSVFKYDLPQIQEEAYSLQLVKQDADSICFALLKSGNKTPGYLLLGHCRGDTRFMGTGILETQRSEVSVPTRNFPEGILTFTLFVNRVPRAERLVYLEKEENVRFNLIRELTGKSSSSEDFILKAFRKDSSPVMGNFSLEGWDPGLENSLDTLENIRNYLLFSSDLQGEVLRNTTVFNPDDQEYNRKRELMLLTYGWRRFNWVDVASRGNGPLPYSLEKGLYLNGRICRKLTGKPVPKNFEVTIILQKNKSVHVDKTYTGEDGKFSFDLPDFSDSVSLTIQTRNRLDQQRDYIIDLNTNLEHFRLNSLDFDKIVRKGALPLVQNLPVTEAENRAGERKAEQQSVEKVKPGTARKLRIDNYYFPGKDTFLIEEVEARSNFLNQRDSMISQSGQPDVVIESAQLKKLTEEKAWYSNLWDLLSDQVPGLQITQGPYDSGVASKYNLVIADTMDENLSADTFAANLPAVYFRVLENPDGYLYIFVDHDLLNNPGIPLFDFLSYMDPGEIESINFIAKPKNYDINIQSTSLLADVSLQTIRDNLSLQENEEGNLFPDQTEFMEKIQRSTAPPAFLFITTKSKGGIFYKKSKGIQSLYLKGITATRQFYVPKYKAEQTPLINRKTICWLPQIKTDSTGTARVTLPLGLAEQDMIVRVQGVSLDGKSGSGTFVYSPGTKDKTATMGLSLTKELTDTIQLTIDSYKKSGLYSGRVTDAETGRPLPFADFLQDSPYYHECTNSDGGFFIAASRLNKDRKIVVSCPGYQSRQVSLPFSIDSVIRVSLVKAPVLKAEKSVKALSIVRDAIRKSDGLYASKEGFQGYNRETVAVDDDIYGIYEMAFNYSNSGYPGSPSSIRFETVKFKNMEDKNGHRLMMLKPNHRSLFYPLKADVLLTAPEFWQLETTGQFDYEEVGQVEYDGELCYKIRFRQNDKLVVALQSGILYIGKQTGALRYAAWNTSPDKREHVSYVSYLQSNPMNDEVRLEDDYNQASYHLVEGRLYLLGTNRQISVRVNNLNDLHFNNRLSIAGKSQRYYKDITNMNTDMLIEKQKGLHMLVRDAGYRIGPWLNLGIIRPEEKLVRDAVFMHDISQYK